MNNYLGLALVSRSVLKRGLIVLAILLLAGCVSSGPATRYYSLFSPDFTGVKHVVDTDIALGVGPFVLPEFLDNPSVVSLTSGQRVRVSGYDAWAGDLSESMTRVVAADLGKRLSVKSAWSFPWDNRVRPSYQIRIVFEEFAGVRGGNVSLRARWTLLNRDADTLIHTGLFADQKRLSSDSVEDYVAVLNGLLVALSISIAETLPQHLAK